MISASGLIYKNGAFTQGSARTLGGRLRLSQHADSVAEVSGIILPKTVNCHTHLGDAFIKAPENCTVEELVAPPDGLKHRMLRKVGETEQVNSMRECISVMAATGTSHFMDFRESGLEGARRLLLATLGSGIRPVILGRPETNDVNELSAILSVADGIGMSALSDVEHGHLSEISCHAKSVQKIFAMHASEAKREDFGKIQSLDPDLLIHMVKADGHDLGMCASAGIPVAICPGSYAYFGTKPPLREMLDAGITVCLGSDNAMISEPDMFRQMAVLRRMFPETKVSHEEIVEIAFSNGRKVLNSLPGLGDANMAEPDFFVLEAPVDDPYAAILNMDAKDIRMFE